MEHVGLIGQPNSGKSSLFNALTGLSTPVAPHPYTTSQSAAGVAQVPDSRLMSLAEMSHSKKIVPAGVEIVDIAGLAPGASKGEGLGNKLLAGVREVDALCFVLRSFKDENIVGSSDPSEALLELELELVIADLAAIESQVTKKRRSSKGDKSLLPQIESMEAAQAILEAGVPIYRSDLSEERRELLKDVFLLTSKKAFAVVNISEDQIGSDDEIIKGVKDVFKGSGEVLGVCVQLEAEAAQMEPLEKKEMLEELGLGQGALARVAQASHELLGLRTFLTTGDKESRAWTFRQGSTAPVCAGVIHSDLQRGFIKAEVIAWDLLLEIGSWHEAKVSGKIRLEGKDYVVADGDVMEIRFNV
ncbi:MAG: redox-regulated ATPase YchF [Acidimicrobiales bacterium]|nr:redox-regulated ATPase YchF [Acidimicrobiales bacterium]